MHDDSCMATATSMYNSKLVLHCWRPPHAPYVDHYDRDLAVFWRHAPQAAPEPARRRPLRRQRPELVMT